MEKGNGKRKREELFSTARPKPLADFTLLESKKTAEDFINIKIEGGNPGFLRHIFCSLQNGAEGSWQQMTQDGDVQFPL